MFRTWCSGCRRAGDRSNGACRQSTDLGNCIGNCDAAGEQAFVVRVTSAQCQVRIRGYQRGALRIARRYEVVLTLSVRSR